MRITRRIAFLVLLTIALAACAPDSGTSDEPLPTLFPSPTAPIEMESAYRIAIEYLDAWRRSDFDAMYDRISVASQEANDREAFRGLYEETHNLMTLDTLTFDARTIARDADRIVSFVYDLTFETDILGDFADTNRTMTLVLDRQVNDWRVAWSRADIFYEMGAGASLRFEASPPARANIYDRNGVVLADQRAVVVQTWVIEEEIPDREACIPLLAEAVNKTQENIINLFDQSGPNWNIRVGTTDVVAYERLNEGLRENCDATFQQQPVRSYPQGTLMPHIIGNVGLPDEEQVPDLVRSGFNSETVIGQSGIESSWDEVLRGRPGGRLVLVARDGTRLRTLSEVAPVIPESLWLTIDADLQAYALRTLDEAYEENSAGWGSTSKGASAVIMDVNTGAILALASYPTFDGNALNPFPSIGREAANEILEDLAQNERVPQLNRPVQGVYPSGSTFKVVPALASLDSGLYTPQTRFVSTGTWRKGNDVRRDWLSGGHGSVDTATALTVSCNSCFYEVGYLMDEIDPFELPNYARRMGLGRPTGLTDIAEAAGNIPDPDWVETVQPYPWAFSDAVSLAIGQGYVQVTPLQMARMYAAIANRGTLYRPQLVRERGILDQRTFVAEPEANGSLDVEAWILDELHRGLCAVTTESYGTAEFVFRNSPLQDIGVCGKTGTAEDPAQVNTHAWFVGWAPREEPEIIVLVMVENAGEGSEVAAPLVRRLMEFYFFRDEYNFQ